MSKSDTSVHDPVRASRDDEPFKLPAGSVELIYCEQCGVLIRGGVRDPGVRPADSERICKKCEYQDRANKDRPSTRGNPIQRSGESTRETASNVKPGRRTTAHRRGATPGEGSTRSKRSSAVLDGAQQNRTLWLYGVIGGVSLLGLGLLLFTRSDPAATRHESKGEKVLAALGSAESHGNRPAPAAVPAQGAKSGGSASLGAVERSVAPVAPAVTPRVAAAVTEPEAAPAAPAVPAAPAPAKAEVPVPGPVVEQPKAEGQVVPPATQAQDGLARGLGAEGAVKPRKGEEEEEDGADLLRSKAPAAPNPEEKAGSKDGGGDSQRARNPFAPPDGPAAPAQGKKVEPPAPVPVPLAAPVVKPAYTPGTLSELFPPSRESRVNKLVVPAAQANQPARTIDEVVYDGWNWTSNTRAGFSVAKGEVSLERPGIFALAAFRSVEFDLSFELNLAANSALGLQYGAAKEHINLLLCVPGGVVSGIFEPAKTQNNVTANPKYQGRSRPAGPWQPYRISVRALQVQVFSGAGPKPILEYPPAAATASPMLGFLVLGQNNNQNPSLKLRKVSLLAPK